MKINGNAGRRIEGSITTHIVRNYASNGRVALPKPNSTMGRAFRSALKAKGVVVS